MKNHFTDGVALGNESFLVLRHHISFQIRAVMEIVSDQVGNPAGILDFLHREIEEGPVVGLELDDPVLCQDVPVAGQELVGGQPAFGMPLLGPGIGEVQVDPLHLTGGEYLVDEGCVHPDEMNVGKGIFLDLLYCPDKDGGEHLYTDVVDLGVGPGHFHEELPFSHADLDMDGQIVPEVFLPVSFVFFYVFQGIFISRDPLAGASDIFQSHVITFLSVILYQL